MRPLTLDKGVARNHPSSAINHDYSLPDTFHTLENNDNGQRERDKRVRIFSEPTMPDLGGSLFLSPCTTSSLPHKPSYIYSIYFPCDTFPQRRCIPHQSSSFPLFQSCALIDEPPPLKSNFARNSGGTVGMYFFSLSLLVPP